MITKGKRHVQYIFSQNQKFSSHSLSETTLVVWGEEEVVEGWKSVEMKIHLASQRWIQ